jgi:hypothetical protein
MRTSHPKSDFIEGNGNRLYYLDWGGADGFAFRILRTAGEPNKIYKDELLKVIGSMK